MEELNKRSRIQNSAVALFSEQGVEATSVNDIVRRANVAKGTFYIYYKDKKELISQILTEKHGKALNDLMNASYEKSRQGMMDWRHAFANELISFYRHNPKILKMIQKNITSIFDCDKHREQVLAHIEKLDAFLQCFHQEKESRKDAMNRFMLMMEMIGVISFHAIFYEQPDTMDSVEPVLLKMIERMYL